MTGTLVSLTVGGLLNRRRVLGLGLLGAVHVLVAVLQRLAEPSGADSAAFTGRLLADFGLAVLLPLVAVIVGTAVLGSELDDGTIVHVLARPVARARIVLTRLGVAWLVVVALVAIPIVAAGLVGRAGDPDLAVAYGAASIIAALEYTAVFVALSLVTSRALIIGLAYVVVWEGVVSGLFAGTRLVSIRQHALAVADALGGDGTVPAEVDPAAALLTMALVTGLATILAVRRLEVVELRGETA